jgi:uncharacterized protein with PIN domain
MIDSLPRCNQCDSPVTDSIQVEIENHGRVKMGKNIQDLWICNECITNRVGGVTSTIRNDTNSSIA